MTAAAGAPADGPAAAGDPATDPGDNRLSRCRAPSRTDLAQVYVRTP